MYPVPMLLRNIEFYLMFLGQSVYCHLDLSAVQCVEHLCTCYSKSSMNTKPVYVLLLEWPQFIYVTADLKLLRQISIVRLPLKKRHT